MTVASAIRKHRERMNHDPERLGFVRADEEMDDASSKDWAAEDAAAVQTESEQETSPLGKNLE